MPLWWSVGGSTGSPGSLYLAYLGTIEVWDDVGTGDIAVGTGGRAKWPSVVMFWQRVSRQLDTLGGRCDRQAVEGMIAAKVPRFHVPMSSVMKITSHMPSRKCQYIAV